MEDLITERIFFTLAPLVIHQNLHTTVIFDLLSMGACKTRHWQTSGRLVHELNVGTVDAFLKCFMWIAPLLKLPFKIIIY